MKRSLRWLAVCIGAAGLVLAAIALNSLAHYEGWAVPRLEPAELSAKLSPYYRLMKPAGEGPFPTALLYSGCDGPRDNVVRWAEMLNGKGWAAIIVDSHGSRGFSSYGSGGWSAPVSSSWAPSEQGTCSSRSPTPAACPLSTRRTSS